MKCSAMRPLLLLAGLAAPARAQSSAGWFYNPDAGARYHRGDFSATVWGFAERHWGPHSPVVAADAWRRVRQGVELALPQFRIRGLAAPLRPVLVYEVDLTNNNLFRSGRRAQVFENAYVALQRGDDAARGRVLFGENTHILSREDNLSSGNLPTINRSLVLEEHGSVNSFGTQWGIEASHAVSSRVSLAVSAQDNRGSLNTVNPRYVVGNSVAAKLSAVALDDTVRGRLTVGAGADYTRNIRDRTFVLASAIGAQQMGGAIAEGNKLSFEGDLAYIGRTSFPFANGTHPYSVDAEFLASKFSTTGTDVGGGYVQLQVSVFDSQERGDLDPFVRYDVVYLDRDRTFGAAVQHATRAGLNYNLPGTRKFTSLHVEYALNQIGGPIQYVPEGSRRFGEVRVGLRVNAARYVRH